MKILHTADLHIKNEEHFSIVKEIIRAANQEKVELIIIAGDLFDASADGRSLEAGLIPIWQEFQGEILVVPGNHDDKYLKNRHELASNVIVANQYPYSVAKINELYFVCVPYQGNIALSDIDIPELDPAILITHGTYNPSNPSAYFPIFPNDLQSYRYVALGHFHTWFNRWEKGTCIVNPGAPRQTRKSDKGARYVSLLDTVTWTVEKIELGTMFVERRTVSISVSNSDKEIQDKLLKVTEFLLEYPQAQLELTLQGSMMFSNYSLSQRLETWQTFLALNDRPTNQITWKCSKITQIVPKIMYSSFGRIMVDKISETSPQELEDLAPFLFERLQKVNEKLLN